MVQVKKLCISLRRNAKDERVLFHYNGHGVPKPTKQGELWVFNKAYTQYIPLSLYELQAWLGAPCLYVFDCSGAGQLLDSFGTFAAQHERERGAAASYRHCLQLAACGATETLPAHPELPADLFTACLTTPVKTAVRWFVLTARTRVAPAAVRDLLDKIPGQPADRRSMLGELHWIFTAVTDTVAWSALPPDLFQRLFRADLLTASLCRNFLLAQRIMRGYNCTPAARPALPELANHPLWAAWDHALDLALAQLPALQAGREYRPSAFFRDQLSAFRVWLRRGSELRAPPDQLPMVLQVLLSTLHRERALRLLCRFLALGPRAVRAVLAVGIFPYMLKLLQAHAPDLRPAMLCVWARIVAADPSCRRDLVAADGHRYFLRVLADPAADTESAALAAFVLATVVDGHPAGQQAALQGSLLAVCLERLDGPPRLLRWLCLCLGRAWRHYDAAKWSGVRDLAHEKLYPLLRHDAVEVRAACAFALGTFVQPGAGERSEHAALLEHQVAAELARAAAHDASSLVRQEILAALQWIVLSFEQSFAALAAKERGRVDPGREALEERTARAVVPPGPAPSAAFGFGSVHVELWRTLRALERDPHPRVASMAADIVSHAERPRPACSSLPPSPNSRGDALANHARTLPSRRARPDDAGPRDAIVTTRFSEWAAASFWADDDDERRRDPESAAHQERRWRYCRNRALRRAAAGAPRATRLDQQTFTSRCPLPPGVLAFHPYEQHVAVAARDRFSVWDWGAGARLCGAGWGRAGGRVTALRYINEHDRALLALASSSGGVALYRPRAEPVLVAAWRALDPTPLRERPPPAQPVSGLAQLVSEHILSGEERAVSPGEPAGGTRLAWCGRSCWLSVGGRARTVRVWELQAERRLADLSTDSEAAVSELQHEGDLLVAGYQDGAICVWDVRCYSRGPVLRARPHTAPVLCARRLSEHALVSGAADGRLLQHDLRAASSNTALPSTLCLQTPGPLSALAVHPTAHLVAW